MTFEEPPEEVIADFPKECLLSEFTVNRFHRLFLP